MTGTRAYPMPAQDDDARFTIGLMLDVADVLARHGYPQPSADDLVELGQALFRFLYTTSETSAPESLSGSFRRQNLTGFVAFLTKQRDEASAGYARNKGSGYEPPGALDQGYWRAYRLALDSLHTWTDGKFGVPLDDQPALPGPPTAPIDPTTEEC